MKKTRKQEKKGRKKVARKVANIPAGRAIKEARKGVRKLPEASNEQLAVREEHKQWAAILCDKRKKDQHREVSNKVYHAFNKSLVYYFMRKLGTGADLLDIQDLTMITLEKVFSKIKLYKAKNGAFSTWVFRIALNSLIDHKRAAKDIDVVSVEAINAHNVRTVGEQDAELFELTSDDFTPFDMTVRVQRGKMVRDAVARLSNDNERKVAEMRFFDECKYDEIAEQLEMPIGTVKALLFRAKDNLQKILQGDLELEEA